ncbi:MAG: radical SAM family heme chaperone HemW [Bacteroidetes bacterium]|jgi:oxygen-independent coproporphyrinogen-3 oxidase|nr:radical SAM family heme chaperone HemW [Bacteroidota bacterium]
MAGLYLHIPFCKTRCHYCDFYKTTDKRLEDEFVKALFIETDHKKSWLVDEPVETIYFGGGTPSYLGIQNLIDILQKLYSTFKIADGAEVTLEVNPDDINHNWLHEVCNNTPVNRLSMGVQSFRNKDLSLMNRRHTADEAMQSLNDIFAFGFTNVSIDLIYGLPGLSKQEWIENLQTAFSFPVKHLSAYHLTFEPGTKFYQWQQQKRLLPVDEDLSLDQFKILLDCVKEQGFEQYEISNFSVPGYYSKHNLNYWRHIPYLGFGPSAHSFHSNKRQWNVAGLRKYIKALKSGALFYEEEDINEKTQYNDQIVTGLRTRWGLRLDHINPAYRDYFLQEAERFINQDHLVLENNSVRITEKGLFISDHIMSELMYVGEGLS